MYKHKNNMLPLFVNYSGVYQLLN